MHSPFETNPNSKPTVGFIIGNLSDQYSARIWDGTVTTLRKNDVNTITFLTFSSARNRVPATFQLIRNKLVNPASLDQVIVHTGLLSYTFGYDAVAEWVRVLRQQIPTVVITIPVDDCPAILVDNYSGVKETVEHLIVDHNRQHFAFVVGQAQEHIERKERLRAMVETVREHGLKLDESLIYRGRLWIDGAQEAIEHFYDNREQPLIDAIVCGSDVMAQTVISELNARNIRVPEDVVVTGFDDLLASRYSEPTLTSINQSIYKQGEAAAQTAVAQIAGEPVNTATYLPTVLKKRASCGCIEKSPESIDDRELKMSQTWSKVNENAHRLTNARTVKQLAESIEMKSREIGLELCYIFEISNSEETQQAQFYCGCNQDGVLLPSDAIGEFDSSNVLPDALWEMHPDFHLIVGLLHTDDEVHSYYMVTDVGVAEEWMYEALRTQISSTLNVIKLLEKEKQYASELELQVAQRTFELETLLRERASWLRIAAHDLRNPLAVINLAVGLIGAQEKESSSEKLQRNLARIQRSTDSMNTIIGRFLTIGRIEANQIAIERHEVNFSVVLNELVESQSIYAKAKEITIETSIESDSSGLLDASLLSQVCTNLLSNAIKYSPIQTTIVVGSQTDGDCLIITVQDQGLGFTEEDKEKLYSPFTPLSAKPTNGEGSIGLGLFVVQKLMHAMDGSIQLESDGRNTGSKFIVSVPLIAPDS